jgi:hypothetical protein
LDAFLLYAKACIDRGCLLNIGNEKVWQNRAVTSFFLGERLDAEGYDLTPKKKKAKADNIQTAKKDFLGEFKSVIGYLRQREFITIAHPNLFPTKISVPGRLASVVHSIIGENSYGEVDHYGNTGSLVFDKRSKLFHAIMTQVVEKAGYDGMKKIPDLPHQQFVPPVLGTKGLYSLSTETVDNDPFPSIFRVLGLPVDGFPEQTAEFTTRLKETCIKLLPENKQGKPYRFRFHPSILVNGRESLGDTSFSAQAGHIDFSEDILMRMVSKNIYPFVAIQPLTKEGSFLRVHTKLDQEEPTEEELMGEMVFIPHGTLFLSPGSLVHGGGYRTGPRGNLRLHFVIYIIDSNLSEREAKEAIPTSFTQTYVGEQAEDVAAGYLIEGEKGLRKEAKNIFDCPEIKTFMDLIGF